MKGCLKVLKSTLTIPCALRYSVHYLNMTMILASASHRALVSSLWQPHRYAWKEKPMDSASQTKLHGLTAFDLPLGADVALQVWESENAIVVENRKTWVDQILAGWEVGKTVEEVGRAVGGRASGNEKKCFSDEYFITSQEKFH